MPAAKRSRLTTILAKIETTYGTDSLPTGANAIRVYNGSVVSTP